MDKARTHFVDLFLLIIYYLTLGDKFYIIHILDGNKIIQGRICGVRQAQEISCHRQNLYVLLAYMQIYFGCRLSDYHVYKIHLFTLFRGRDFSSVYNYLRNYIQPERIFMVERSHCWYYSFSGSGKYQRPSLRVRGESLAFFLH